MFMPQEIAAQLMRIEHARNAADQLSRTRMTLFRSARS